MLTIAQKFWGSDPQNCLPSGVEKRGKRVNIFQRGLLGEVVHDHFSQGRKIRMEQNMPLLFRQSADLDALRFQFRKELQRDPGFQTDNIIQKGGGEKAEIRPAAQTL